MRKLIASRLPGADYDIIVSGVVDSIEYHEDLDEWFAYIYSRDLEKEPYSFYQGVVVFEPLTDEEVNLDLHEGDKVKLGVILQDDGNDVVDILDKTAGVNSSTDITSATNIAGSYSGDDDVEFFDLPRAYCTRLKKYIIDNDSDMLPTEVYSGEPYTDEDFINSLDSLQLIFDSKKDLYGYVLDATNYCPVNDPHLKNLQSIIDYYEPDMDDTYFLEDLTQKHKYVITGYDPATGEEPVSPLDKDDPGSAIEDWFIKSEKYPSCICICAKDDAAAKELLSWVVDNEDKFRELYRKYKNPYKLEYLLDNCKRYANDSNLIDWSGDQVFPFSLG